MAAQRNLRITLEYEGTAYYGWQVQAGRKTVQGELERAVHEITGRRSTIIGAGRTDAGVHAQAQVANFRTSSRLSAAKWPLALNAHLPPDIGVVRAEEVALEFHAQFAAKEKTYRYRILNRDTPSALRRAFVHFIRRPLEVDKMREAARHLVGTHDFRAFGSEMSKKERTTRTLRAADVERIGDEACFTFTGDGFLYNQVRAMVGTLLEVGLDKQVPAWVKEILESRDRTKAGANVPAKGLCLMEVRYDETS
ncbi:MAG: tRNA pseudouridine(38-40) synthase TruA [Planctomycetes bacterium]|nr:tRNA pseudouridine(38-40) synthase TruA [Planctomycetota bacterium]